MTSLSMVEAHSPVGNPIDLVEEIVVANEWAHDRASEEEMIVEISGRWCDYRMYFLWQEELSALHFSCGFDMKVPKRRRGALYELLALANERLWLGHFDLAAGEASSRAAGWRSKAPAVPLRSCWSAVARWARPCSAAGAIATPPSAISW